MRSPQRYYPAAFEHGVFLKDAVTRFRTEGHSCLHGEMVNPLRYCLNRKRFISRDLYIWQQHNTSEFT